MYKKILLDFLKSGILRQPGKTYIPGTPLLLFGFTDGTVPDERGTAVLYEQDGFLCAEGLFQDADLFNQAVLDNEKTWLLGDTFELMFRCPGKEDYYEFHTTPGGIRLQLRIPDYRTFRSIRFEQLICDMGLTVSNEYENGLWHPLLRIPFERLQISSLKGASFVIVRQNHTHGSDHPVITATQIFPETAHFPPLWSQI